MRNCIECDKEFKPLNALQLYCSQKCAKIVRNRRYYQKHSRRETLIGIETEPLKENITKVALQLYRENYPNLEKNDNIVKEYKIFLLPHKDDDVNIAMSNHARHRIRTYCLRVEFQTCLDCSGDENETEKQNNRTYKFISRQLGRIGLSVRELQRRHVMEIRRGR